MVLVRRLLSCVQIWLLRADVGAFDNLIDCWCVPMLHSQHALFSILCGYRPRTVWFHCMITDQRTRTVYYNTLLRTACCANIELRNNNLMIRRQGAYISALSQGTPPVYHWMFLHDHYYLCGGECYSMVLLEGRWILMHRTSFMGYSMFSYEVFWVRSQMDFQNPRDGKWIWKSKKHVVYSWICFESENWVWCISWLM